MIEKTVLAGNKPLESKKIPWYAVYIVILAMFGWMLVNMDSAFYVYSIPALMSTFHLTIVNIGTISLVAYTGVFIGLYIWGPILDYFGRKTVFQLTIAFVAIFSLLSAISWSALAFTGFRFGMGAGNGGEWPAGGTMITETVGKKFRGLAMGIMQGGFQIGYLIAAVISVALIPVYGFRSVFFVGVIPAILIVFARLKVKETSRYQKLKELRKAVKENDKVTIERLKDIARPEQVKKFTYGQLFGRDLRRRTTGLMIWSIGSGLSNSMVVLFMETYFMNSGFSYVTSALMYGIITGLSYFGYLSAGWISDYIGRRETLALYTILSALLFYLAIFPLKSLLTGIVSAGFVLWVLADAFWSGSYASIIAATTESYPTRARGTGSGLVLGTAWLSFAVASQLSSITIADYGYISAWLWWAIVPLVVASFGIFVMKRVPPRKDLEEIGI